MNTLAPPREKKSAMMALAARCQVEPAKLTTALRETVFKGASDSELMALVVVANEYKLNPFTKEIFAFSSNGGITPVVSIDGWVRIINEHPQFDGMEFEQDEDSCTCIMYRKDRGRPISITEYHSECARNTAPWKQFPKRMLRHKALIQCARITFGFSGIYDEDEAEVMRDVSPEPKTERRDPVFARREEIKAKAEAITVEPEPEAKPRPAKKAAKKAAKKIAKKATKKATAQKPEPEPEPEPETIPPEKKPAPTTPPAESTNPLLDEVREFLSGAGHSEDDLLKAMLAWGLPCESFESISDNHLKMILKDPVTVRETIAQLKGN